MSKFKIQFWQLILLEEKNDHRTNKIHNNNYFLIRIILKINELK